MPACNSTKPSAEVGHPFDMKTTTPFAPADLAKAIQASGSKGHFKRNAILGLIVLALGVGGWFWRSRIEKAKQQVPLYVTEPLTRGDIFSASPPRAIWSRRTKSRSAASFPASRSK